MFRALHHEGQAAGALFEVLCGGRTMTSDQTMRAWTGCAVLAHAALRVIRGGIR